MKTGEIYKGKRIAWAGQDGPQMTFLRTTDREVLYGGAAGGGKSDGLLGAALLQIHNPFYKAVIFRRSFPELSELMGRARRIYPHAGGIYKAGLKRWVFPSGAFIEFAYLKNKDDHEKYQGKEWSFIGFDELTHFRENQYVYLCARCRAPEGFGLRLMIRATTNPGSNGHVWVKRRFRIPGAGTATRFITPDTKWVRRFIPARVSDNRYFAGGEYERTLDGLDEVSRKMLKEGRWDVVAGSMFATFDHTLHTCDEFAIPVGWPLWRGADDGYNNPACVLWFTRSNDGRIFIIDELYKSGMTPEEMARRTLAKDRTLQLWTGGEVIENDTTLEGALDSSAWADTGMGKKGSEGRGQVMNNLGCRWTPCEKNPGSRVAGVSTFQSLLKKKPDGRPGIVFFKRCKSSIETIPVLQIDETDREDVDTEGEDHAWDALRYGLQFRKSGIKMQKLKGL